MIAWEPYGGQPLDGPGAPPPLLLRHAAVRSNQLDNERPLVVALPPRYHEEQRKYPVVYMHDGQNLFDPATSYVGHWGLERTLGELAEEGLEVIVVAVPNMGRQRLHEYTPFPDVIHGGGDAGRYLDFLCDTVKPLVDGSFRTRPQRAYTSVAGSSLGGLVSLYALFERPDVFGAAGVLSPSLWFADGAIFDWLESRPAPRARIHLDSGTEEGADQLYDVRRLRGVLEARGYLVGESLAYIEEAGADHHEAAWGRRMRDVLPFLVEGRSPRCTTSS